LGAGAASVHAQADGAQRWAFTTLSTATAGTILSSPATGPDGTVYFGVEVGSATSTSASGRVFALAPGGEQKWVFTAPDWVDATPAVGGDGTIYFGCWNGVLYALRPDGTRRWELKVGTFVASSPALGTDGTIYVGAGANLVAVSPEGTLRWSFPAGDWIDASPAIGPDGTIHVGSWDGNFYAIGPEGTERWRYTTEGGISGSAAIAADGTVYFGSRDARLYAVENGRLRWRIETGDTIDTAPALGADGTIHVTTGGGRLLAFGRDGAERWRYPAAGQAALAPIYSSPAVRADGSVVFGSSNNALYAVRSGGSLLWRTALGDVTDSSPLITADTIYIGAADKRLYAIASTGGVLATDWPQFRRDPARSGWQPHGAVPATQGRLVNLSVRTVSGLDADTLIVGFVVGGAGGRSLLVRGVGPTLAGFGVAGVLGDPRIGAFAGETQLATNDDWGQAPNAAAMAGTAAAVGAFPLAPGSSDAALLREFAAGSFTVQVAGAGSATGVVLMEAYDAGGGAGARLINLSARSAVNAAASGVLIAGFVVGGEARSILVRGVGPALTGFGVGGALANPHLRIFRGAQVVAENDDWGVAGHAGAMAAAAAGVGGFALPAGGRDAALLVTLPPGPYTAQISGVGGATGVALIEVYEVP
jgi:outer membrane protein assembly factor BamB